MLSDTIEVTNYLCNRLVGKDLPHGAFREKLHLHPCHCKERQWKFYEKMF